MSKRPTICILGAGFAGLAAARRLRELLPRATIRMVAPTRSFVYRPSLIWIPVGLRTADDLHVPLEPFLARRGISFTPAEVNGIEARGRLVTTSRGMIRNDVLVIATGADPLAGPANASPLLGICGGVAAAERTRAALFALQHGTIAVGCGAHPDNPGATRCHPMLELAFGIETWLRRRRIRARYSLLFFTTAAEPFKRFGLAAEQKVKAELQRRDIELHVHAPEPYVSNPGVRSLGADLVLFNPGLTGAAWLADTGLPLSAGGFVVADEHCAVPGLEGVFVAGDVGCYPGPAWAPKLAHNAQLQARVAASSIHAFLDGQPPTARLHQRLACVIDTIEGGIGVYRDDAHAAATPHGAPLHWAKRAIEKRFLADLRHT